jgi:hypothetical protein
LLNPTGGYPGVTAYFVPRCYTQAFETLSLNFHRRQNPPGYSGAPLLPFPAGRKNPRGAERNPQLDPVKESAAQLAPIAADLVGGTETAEIYGFFRTRGFPDARKNRAQPAAGAAISRKDELKIRGQPQGPFGADYGNDPVLQGFPEGLKHRDTEFRRLIQKEYPQMGQCYLAGPDNSAASKYAFGTGGMVG